MSRPLQVYEFFAGGGMARLGLGEAWTCSFANDFDPIKAAVYGDNFSDAGDHFRAGDIWSLSASDLPGQADLAWASSPCQDLSLAGTRAGLDGGRSSAFHGFWRLIEALGVEGRSPPTLVIENVSGLLTSGRGQDLVQLARRLAEQGYRFGILEIDTAWFLPQSRPRIFIIATRLVVPDRLTGPSPFRTRGVVAARDRLPPELQDHWIHWACPAPPPRRTQLVDLLETGDGLAWHDQAQSDHIASLMPPPHLVRARTEALKEEVSVATLYRRTRPGHGQRAEARFDGLAGCLRTPKGGSSRQTLMVMGKGQIRTRLMTPREGARLMGLGETYRLPKGATAGFQVVGDGVAVPVVAWLNQTLLEPLARSFPAPAPQQSSGAKPAASV